MQCFLTFIFYLLSLMLRMCIECALYMNDNDNENNNRMKLHLHTYSSIYTNNVFFVTIYFAIISSFP